MIGVLVNEKSLSLVDSLNHTGGLEVGGKVLALVVLVINAVNEHMRR